MSNKMRDHNKGAIMMMAFIALCMLLTGLFFVVAGMMPVFAASFVITPYCKSTHCPPTPTPKPTKPPTPTPSPTPSPTPKPTNTPNPTPTTGHNPPTPSPTSPPGVNTTPTAISTPVPGGPVPPATATAQANQTPTTTTQSTGSGLPPGGSPPAGGNSGGSSTGIVFTFAALVLTLAAFLLYLIPQGQSSLLVRLLSLVLPTSLARRFGAK